MFRRLEKKFNTRIINMLTIGTHIENPTKSRSSTRYKLKQFFKEGMDQFSKSLNNKQPPKQTFRQKIGIIKPKPKKKKTFREKLWFKD